MVSKALLKYAPEYFAKYDFACQKISLELVEIFQIAATVFEKRRSVEVDMARARRAAVPAPGGSYGVWDHSSCV